VNDREDTARQEAARAAALDGLAAALDHLAREAKDARITLQRARRRAADTTDLLTPVHAAARAVAAAEEALDTADRDLAGARGEHT
jgi:hypothetical protein